MTDKQTHPQLAGYQYIHDLGTGGFANVYLYEQNTPNRKVAVKVMTQNVRQNPQAETVFRNEINIMTKLSSHPAIMPVYEANITPDGRPYFTMEMCPRQIGQEIKQRPLAITEILNIGVTLAGALETAHKAGVLHRDIKPSNVMVKASGDYVITDFGIADYLGVDTSAQENVALSLPWAAPEVVTGDTTGTVASEIWSLAATLYTMAAGSAPWSVGLKNSEDRKDRIIKYPYPEIQADGGYQYLNQVLARAMEKSPEYRFASMAEFGDALRWVQQSIGAPVTEMKIIGVDITQVRNFAYAQPTQQQSQLPPTRLERRMRAGQISAPPKQEHKPVEKREKRFGSGVVLGIVGSAVVMVSAVVIAKLCSWI